MMTKLNEWLRLSNWKVTPKTGILWWTLSLCIMSCKHYNMPFWSHVAVLHINCSAPWHPTVPHGNWMSCPPGSFILLFCFTPFLYLTILNTVQVDRVHSLCSASAVQVSFNMQRQLICLISCLFNVVVLDLQCAAAISCYEIWASAFFHCHLLISRFGPCDVLDSLQDLYLYWSDSFIAPSHSFNSLNGFMATNCGSLKIVQQRWVSMLGAVLMTLF